MWTKLGLPLAAGIDAVDHADEHAVILHIGFLREAVAHVDQIGDHPHVFVEPAVGLEQQPHRSMAATTATASHSRAAAGPRVRVRRRQRNCPST